MKRILFTALAFMLLFYQCQSDTPTALSLAGKYENRENKDVINYIWLKKDSTFIQYYKVNEIVQVHSGKWNFTIGPKSCEIHFARYKDFVGVLEKDKLFFHSAWLKNNRITLFEDLSGHDYVRY